MDFPVVNSQADDFAHLLFYQFVQNAVVIALVRASYYPDHRPGLAVKCVPGGIHIGRLGVVDVEHIPDAEHRLQPVFDRLEALEGIADNVVADAGSLCCQGCRHRVVEIVLSAESQLVEVDFRLVFLVLHHNLVVLQIGALLHLLLLGERKHLGLGDDFVQMAYGDGVVGVEDEAVVRSEIADDTELRPYVVLQIVVVSVQMVRSDIGDDGYIRAEIKAAVQLEAADFQNIEIVLASGYLKGVALAYIASQTHIEPCLTEQVVDERGSGGLAVGSGDADFLCAVVAGSEFDFGDHVGSLGLQFPDYRHGVGNAGTFDNLVSVEDQGFRMPSLLVGNLPFFQGLLVLVLNLPVV